MTLTLKPFRETPQYHSNRFKITRSLAKAWKHWYSCCRSSTDLYLVFEDFMWLLFS